MKKKIDVIRTQIQSRVTFGRVQTIQGCPIGLLWYSDMKRTTLTPHLKKIILITRFQCNTARYKSLPHIIFMISYHGNACNRDSQSQTF